MAKPHFDLTTFGEIMLRLSVPAGTRLEQAQGFAVHAGGAEANMATALAYLGRRCAWHGALPESPLGRLATGGMRLAGVNLDSVIWQPDGRMGSYYVEFSAPPRPIQVVYDRADSCTARMLPEQLNWPALFDTRLIHLTGITPAISANCHEITEQIVDRARQAKIPYVLDINYRAKLWSTEAAAAVLRPLAAGAAILLCSRADAERVFGIRGEPQQVAEQLCAQLGAERAVVTIGAEGVVAWDGQQALREAALPVQIIDRLGAGDALAAGVIHGFLDGDLGQGLRYGVALAALALSQHGDAVVTTLAEVDRLASHAGTMITR
ncbi:MAG: sugar kinase [Roseiflexaceae bacterium]